MEEFAELFMPGFLPMLQLSDLMKGISLFMEVTIRTPWFGTKKYVFVPVSVKEELPQDSNPVFVIFSSPIIHGGLDTIRYSPERNVWETYKEIGNRWIRIEGVTHWLKMTAIAERSMDDLIIAKREHELNKKNK